MSRCAQLGSSQFVQPLPPLVWIPSGADYLVFLFLNLILHLTQLKVLVGGMRARHVSVSMYCPQELEQDGKLTRKLDRSRQSKEIISNKKIYSFCLINFSV